MVPQKFIDRGTQDNLLMRNILLSNLSISMTLVSAVGLFKDFCPRYLQNSEFEQCAGCDFAQMGGSQTAVPRSETPHAKREAFWNGVVNRERPNPRWKISIPQGEIPKKL